MPHVTDAQVASYEAACEALARPLVGRNGAELDDLVQEGRIFVWQSLERGITPSAEMIQNRMRDWARWLGRRDPIPYEEMLPLDDYTTQLNVDTYEATDWLDVEASLGA